MPDSDLSQRVPLGISEKDYTLAQLQAAYHNATSAHDNEVAAQFHDMITNKIQTMRETAAQGSGFGEQLARGYGQAIPRMAEGIANWAGAEGKFNIPGVGTFDSTTEGLKKEDEANRELLKTAGGATGNILGQTVGTAPLGMGTGALLRSGAGFLTRFAPAVAPQILTKIGQIAANNPTKAKVLINALKLGEAGGQGAVQAGAMADPDKQGEAATSGAILNMALGKAGQVGGRVLRGVVEKSPAAQAIMQAAKDEGTRIFLPISQAAAQGGLSGLAKSAYQKVLPYAFTVEGRLKGQSEAAKADVRETMANMQRPLLTSPEGEAVAPEKITGGTPAEQAQKLSAAHAADLKASFDDYLFQVPFDFKDQVDRHLLRMHPGTPEELRNNLAQRLMDNMQIYAPEGELSGANLREVLKQTGTDLDGMGPKYNDNVKDSTLQPVRDIVDNEMQVRREILKRTDDPKVIDQNNKFLSDMENMKVLANQDDSVAAILRATEGAAPTRGAYEFKDLMHQMGRYTQQDSYRLAQNAQEVLGQSPGYASPLGRHAWHTMAGLGVPFGFHFGQGEAGLGFPSAFELTANALSTQPAQNLLYGEGMFGGQKALAEYLRANPAGARALGQAGRSAWTASDENPLPPQRSPYLLPQEEQEP